MPVMLPFYVENVTSQSVGQLVPADSSRFVVLRTLGDYGAEVRRVRGLLSRVSFEYGKTVTPVFVDAARLVSGSDPFIARVAREAISASTRRGQRPNVSRGGVVNGSSTGFRSARIESFKAISLGVAT
jgi:hypothetical protein